MAEERRNAQQDALQVYAVIKQHYHARAKRSANGARPLKRERYINLLGRNKGTCSAAQQYCLQTPCAGGPSRHGKKLAQRGAHGRFVNSRSLNVPAETKKSWPR